MKRHRPALLLVSAVIGVVIAIVGAASAIEWARPVDVVAIFAGAFGSGATLVAAAVSEIGGQFPESAMCRSADPAGDVA